MEDSHISYISIIPGVHLFGVFDGHGGNYCLIKEYVGREVAYYVRDRFLDELKKLQSFIDKDYPKALREAFIKIDDLLKTPQGIKDVKKY